ncbi:hypothetical protein ACXHXG_16045 [Rhizobium sp. LEGMi198b]|nr:MULTISPECIES: hypothetical protein [Rhizobium]UWU24074.1 hypothetical protein N2601_27975 [Rhizobium tropici]
MPRSTPRSMARIDSSSSLTAAEQQAADVDDALKTNPKSQPLTQ